MKHLYLYLISQSANTGYDTYDSAVVVASSTAFARTIYPGGGLNSENRDTWCNISDVHVELLGPCIADYREGDVVCASFNAG